MTQSVIRFVKRCSLCGEEIKTDEISEEELKSWMWEDLKSPYGQICIDCHTSEGISCEICGKVIFPQDDHDDSHFE